MILAVRLIAKLKLLLWDRSVIRMNVGSEFENRASTTSSAFVVKRERVVVATFIVGIDRLCHNFAILE